MKSLICGICLVLVKFSHAQLNDNFSDGNLNQHPEWFGDLNCFEVDSSGSLHLSAPAVTGKSSLSTPSRAISSASWSFDFRTAFNPSSANQAKVYLCSDKPDLRDSLNSYYILIGGIADEVSLFRQRGHSTTKLIDGADKILNRDQLNIHVLASVDGNGFWSLSVDTLNNGNFMLQGTATDQSIQNGGWFGVLCEYTSTRSEKFWFDNFVVSGVPEQITPTVTKAYSVGLVGIALKFSEQIDEQVVPELFLGNISLTTLELSGDSLFAVFDTVKNGIEEFLWISGVSDLAGNFLRDTVIPFLFLVDEGASTNELIISEVMADPSPSVGLPECEYIEILNNSDKVLDLSAYLLINSGNSRSLPQIAIFPGEYVILCDAKNASWFGDSVLVAGVESWVSLNNTGDSLGIADPAGNLIHSLTYSINDHTETFKKAGGWSLERQSPFVSCAAQTIIASSMDTSGGTPGRVNSNWVSTPDTVSPTVVSAELSADSLWVKFSEPISATGTVSYYSGTHVAYRWDEKSLIFQFSIDSVYIITGFGDCGNNQMLTDTISIQYHRSPAPTELVISEIMYDPTPVVELPDAEYIELFNRSSDSLELKGCTINGESLDSSYILPPAGLVVICDNSKKPLFNGLPVIGTGWGSSFLSNSGERVALLNKTGELVASVNYAPEWQSNPIALNGGYSLELITSSYPCEDHPALWRSSTAGKGGTPGSQNTGHSTFIVPEFIVGFTYLSGDTLSKSFNQPILSTGNWQIDDGPISTMSIVPNGIRFTTVPEPGKELTIYADSVLSCFSGYQTFSFKTALPEPANADLQLNELLYDPVAGCEDFVELLNTGKSYLCLQGVQVSNGTQSKHLDSKGLILEPGGLVVFSADTASIGKHFTHRAVGRMVQTDLPNFQNAEGQVTAFSEDSVVLSSFTYSDKLHSQKLSVTEGVSLEKVGDAWGSASPLTGFGSPGLANSGVLDEPFNPGFELSGKRITANDDGVNDDLRIHLFYDLPGLTAAVGIYDINGLPVKTLLKQTPLNGTLQLVWDGTNDKHQVVPDGIYITVLELWDASGRQRVEKEVVVFSN